MRHATNDDQHMCMVSTSMPPCPARQGSSVTWHTCMPSSNANMPPSTMWAAMHSPAPPSQSRHSRSTHLQGSHVGRRSQLGPLLQSSSHQHEAQQHGRLLEVGVPGQGRHGCSHAADGEAGQSSQGDQGVHVWASAPASSPALLQNLPPRACEDRFCQCPMLSCLRCHV